MSAEIIESLKKAVIEMKFDQTAELTRKGLDAGLNAIDILNQALLPALDEVGTLFREGEYFLPDVLMSVKAYNDSYEILQSLLAEGNYKAKGTVMMGTVEGDIHEIGKNILLALLQGNGFKVIDLGVQVPPQKFLEEAQKENPDVIGMSSLLTTTMPAMKETIDLFDEKGLRSNFKIIVGGSPVSQRFADEIGADGYGEDAQVAVELIKKLCG